MGTGRNARWLSTSWLRVIALGLPMGALLLGGCSNWGAQACAPVDPVFTLSAEELDRVQEARSAGGDTLGPAQCEALCRELADDRGVQLEDWVMGCDLGPGGDASFALYCRSSPGCG